MHCPVPGYAQEGPSSQEEEELLSQLVSACFGSTPEGEGDELLGHLLALAGAQAQCAASGVPEKQIQDISSHVGSAVRSLKQQVPCCPAIGIGSEPCVHQKLILYVTASLRRPVYMQGIVHSDSQWGCRRVWRCWTGRWQP